MSTVFRDLSYGLRMLAKNPSFTAVAVLTLGLGIGAATSIFSVVNSVLLRPLPYAEPDRLVMVWESNRQREIPYMFASPPNFADWRAGGKGLEELAAFRAADFTLTGGAEPESVHGAQVSASLFSLLGVKPALGRTFRLEEDQPEGPRVVILAHGTWQRRFGGSPDVLGRTLTLEGATYTVIGVMPRQFRFPPPMALEGNLPPSQPEFWTPLRLRFDPTERSAHFLCVIGRLGAGASREQAESELGSVARRLAREYPQTNAGWEVTVVPLPEQVFGKVRPALVALLGAVGLVLLIACANVVNLLLARGVARQREITVRAALGASRARLLRQLLTESALLAVAGGVAGLLLSYWAVDLAASLGLRNIPRLEEARVDSAVLGFGLAATALTVLLSGLAPALQLSRSGHRGTGLADRSQAGGVAHHRLRRALVAAELALSLVLMIGAGLLFRSFLRLQSVPLGFRSENVVTMSVRLPQASYSGGHKRAQFYAELHRQVASLPGIHSAGFINTIPLGSDRQGTVFLVEGRPAPPPSEANHANFSLVSHDYFRAMGIPLLRGRVFTAADTAEAPPVVLISETLARRHFPGEDPVDRRLMLAGSRRIVGVVGDERHDALEAGFRPNIYLPYAQIPGTRSLALVVRSDRDPSWVPQAVRTRIRELDHDVAVCDVRTMGQVVAAAAAQPRFQTCFFLAFAGIALALAAVGTCGVFSYFVTERFREIGIRVALGACQSEILGMILRQAMGLTLAGASVGLAGAFLLTRYLSSLLFEVRPTDLLTFATAALVLAVVALLATYIPARRATRVDPAVALRYE